MVVRIMTEQFPNGLWYQKFFAKFWFCCWRRGCDRNPLVCEFQNLWSLIRWWWCRRLSHEQHSAFPYSSDRHSPEHSESPNQTQNYV